MRCPARTKSKWCKTPRLRNGKQIRFENGESSVFLLNSREATPGTARVKLAELQAKYAQTQATLRWAAGGVE